MSTEPSPKNRNKIAPKFQAQISTDKDFKKDGGKILKMKKKILQLTVQIRTAT